MTVLFPVFFCQRADINRIFLPFLPSDVTLPVGLQNYYYYLFKLGSIMSLKATIRSSRIWRVMGEVVLLDLTSGWLKLPSANLDDHASIVAKLLPIWKTATSHSKCSLFVSSFDQLACPGESHSLSELTLDGNPVALETWYKQAVLRCVLHLRQLDMKRITVRQNWLTVSVCVKLGHWPKWCWLLYGSYSCF